MPVPHNEMLVVPYIMPYMAVHMCEWERSEEHWRTLNQREDTEEESIHPTGIVQVQPLPTRPPDQAETSAAAPSSCRQISESESSTTSRCVYF